MGKINKVMAVRVAASRMPSLEITSQTQSDAYEAAVLIYAGIIEAGEFRIRRRIRRTNRFLNPIYLNKKIWI